MLDVEIPLATGLPEPVLLRRLTAADAGEFARHTTADHARLAAHLPFPDITRTPEGAAMWLGAFDRQVEGRALAAGAWRGDELIGGTLLLRHDLRHDNIEIGCWVVGAGEGHGVAAAACRVVIGIARAELGVERIEWRAATENVRSRRLAERLGFGYEGRLRSNYVLDGARSDTDLLSLVGAEIDAAAVAQPRAAASA